MNLNITSSPQKDYLLITSTGSVKTKEELLVHAQLLYAEVEKYGARKILVNEPETDFPLELFPYFDLVKNYNDLFPPAIHELKVAIVIADKYKEVGESWQALCVSRGLQYFAFTIYNEALGLLLE